MRILHTSDWHLGQTLHDLPREEEHAAFLAWLIERIVEHDVDALLVTGDIFDSSNPTSQAQRSWYRFLAEAARRRPKLQVVAIAGNHDSPSRLEAPRDVLEALDVAVVGELPRTETGTDPERLLVRLKDKEGVVRAVVAAVPFLRTSDARPIAEGDGEDGEVGEDGEASELSQGVDEGADEQGGPRALGPDPLIEGVRKVYAEAADALRAARTDGQAGILTGHLYASGTKLSELSERKILGGNLHALPADIFAPDVSYVALGHLHLPQAVGGRQNVRYAGAPIPLSLAEADYPHQVVLVELEGEKATKIDPIRVPRLVEILRIPKDGPKPKEEVLPLLLALPIDPDPERTGPDLRPFLEVRVDYAATDVSVRAEVERALEGKNARLVKLERPRLGDGDPMDGQAFVHLSEVTPEQVFRMKHSRDVGGDPPEELLAAFLEVLAEAEDGRNA